MSEKAQAIDEQLQHLLDVVAKNRDEKCDKLLARAREQASDIVKQAYREARQHMRD